MIKKEFCNYRWHHFLAQQSQYYYFKNLMARLNYFYKTENITPLKKNLWRAFTLTPLKYVKVVLIGQDPYFQKGYATGLSFATNNNTWTSSLRNINKELINDYQKGISNTNLESWARQGVLLLNRTLISKIGEAGYYSFLPFTILLSKIICFLNKVHTNLVYVLLGQNALQLAPLINQKNNYLIGLAHPSGLSYTRPCGQYPPFRNSNLFLKINNYLKNHHLREVNFAR